jgi:integrase
MQGSVRKKNKQSWEITIDVGRDENGKRLRKYFHVTGTKAEAQRELRRLLTQLDKGLPVDDSKVATGEFLERWLSDYAEIRTAQRTVDGYRGIIERYLKPELGNVLLAKLKPQHIQKLYSSMMGKGLSARTILHTHRVLSNALKNAVKWGLLVRNVCDAVDPPRPRRKQMNVLDEADISKFLDAIGKSRYGPVFFLMLYTGLRRGETLGLRWCDVDLKSDPKTISVNKSVVRLKNKGIVVTEPKTPYSRRLVTLPESAAALLRGLHAKQMEERSEAGVQWDEKNFVFPHPDGGPLSPDTITHAFIKIIRRKGLPKVRLHDLRHTHATWMIKAGTNPKVVSERLGHSSITITMDTYSHVLPGMQKEAAIAFEEAIQDVIKQPV